MTSQQASSQAVKEKNSLVKKRKINLDFVFRSVLIFLGSLIVLIVSLIFITLVLEAWPSIQTFGFKFITQSAWDPSRSPEVYGALPMIYGTLKTSLIACLIAIPLSIGTAIFLTEWCPLKFRTPLSFLIELLAAIPSIIYGMWAVLILLPFIRDTVYPYFQPLNFIPLFEGPSHGNSVLAGGLILAIMILPTIVAICREVFLKVPREMKEATLALGGTHWESIRLTVLRMSHSGIIGACILGLGRAIGETMAVTMVIGNNLNLSHSIFALGNTLPSIIANQFAEASSEGLQKPALSEIALILMLITVVVNLLARFLVRKQIVR